MSYQPSEFWKGFIQDEKNWEEIEKAVSCHDAILRLLKNIQIYSDDLLNDIKQAIEQGK